MMRFYGFLGALALVALFSILTGCGETVIDSKKTEQALEANLSRALGEKVKSVDCPSGVEVKAGSTFSCTVSLQGGKTETVTLKIRNSDADVSVIGLSGSDNGSNE